MVIIVYDKQTRSFLDVSTIENLKQYIGDTNFTLWVTATSAEDTNKIFNDIQFSDEINKNFYAQDHPRFMVFDGFIFMTYLMSYLEKAVFKNVEVSTILVCDNLLITINESNNKFFNDLMNTLARNKELFKSGIYFLFYSLTDQLFDYYESFLIKWGITLAAREEDLFASKFEIATHDLAQLRKKIIVLKSNLMQHADYLRQLAVLEHEAIPELSRLYFNNAYQKAEAIKQALDQMNTLILNEYNLYFTLTTKRSNDVMQKLTIVATIFMPITFVASFYGMNFKDLPGLGSPWGLLLCILVMLIITLWSVRYFKRKGWY